MPKRRGTKVKKTALTMALAQMQTRHVAALYRVAKTRGRAFFKDANAMMELREELARRA